MSNQTFFARIMATAAALVGLCAFSWSYASGPPCSNSELDDTKCEECYTGEAITCGDQETYTQCMNVGSSGVAIFYLSCECTAANSKPGSNCAAERQKCYAYMSGCLWDEDREICHINPFDDPQLWVSTTYNKVKACEEEEED